MTSQRALTINADPNVWNLDLWSTPTTSTMDADARAFYTARERAVRLYVADDNISVRQIEAATGVKYSLVRKCVERCVAEDQNGRIFGFNACLRSERVTRRGRELVNGKPARGKSANGMLVAMFREHPLMKQRVIDAFLGIPAAIGEPREKRPPEIEALHAFHEECRKLGATNDDWPFNTAAQGEESIRRFLRRYQNRNVEKVTKARMIADGVRVIDPGLGAKRRKAVLRIYECWQFDEHQIDLLEDDIVVFTPNGAPFVLKSPRIALIAATECVSKVIVGYAVALMHGFDAHDVAAVFEFNLEEWTPHPLSIPGVTFSPQAGFPCNADPSLRGVWPTVLQADNHMTHYAKAFAQRLARASGVSVNYGLPGQPVAREVIEGAFGVIEQKVFHRLPNTTGSSPNDVRRNKPEKAAERLLFDLPVLLEAIEWVIAERNGQHIGALQNRSPLEFLRDAIRSKAFLPRSLPDMLERSLSLGRLQETAVVRANLDEGRMPYIERFYATYCGDVLKTRGDLIGQTVIVESGPRGDLSVLEVFEVSGKHVGSVEATGRWAGVKCTLIERRLLSRGFKRAARLANMKGPGAKALQRGLLRRAQELQAMARAQGGTFSISLENVDAHAMNKPIKLRTPKAIDLPSASWVTRSI